MSFVADRGAADLLRPTDLRAAWFAGADVIHLPAYSLLGEPLGLAGRRAVAMGRAAGALISLDLASAGPLLADGRRAALDLVRGVAPDLVFATAGEVAALIGPSGRGALRAAGPGSGRGRQARRRRGVSVLTPRRRPSSASTSPLGPSWPPTRPGPATPSTPGSSRSWLLSRATGRSVNVAAPASGRGRQPGRRAAGIRPETRAPAGLTACATIRPMSIAERLLPSPEVADALAAGRPLVALESTLISHGLPYPQNVTVARASEAAVRESGAVPATVAIRDGRILLGLAEADLEALATASAGTVLKAARPSLALALARGGWAATTVSATMIAAAAAGIRVFATGGIGGVHRGALGAAKARPAVGPARDGGRRPATLDISSDLEELARTPVVVVCAGPKAILDLPLTLEYLETRGVPVLAVGQTEMPGFYSRESGVAAPVSVPDEAAAARLAGTHLGLGLGSGMLVCVPVPESAALTLELARSAVERATRGGRRGRRPRAGPDSLAAGPDRRADRRGKPARQHGPDRERRPVRRSTRGCAGRRADRNGRPRGASSLTGGS